MATRISFVLCLLTLATINSSICTAQADSIGINLNSAGGFINPTDTAGVIAAANWNNVPYSGGAVSNQSLNLASNGSSSGLSLSIAGGYSTTNATGVGFASPADSALMTGHVYTSGGNPMDLVFSGTVPFSHYDLYVYYNSSAVTNQESFSVLTTALSAKGYEVAGGDTSYVLSNGSSTFSGPGAANNANYVVISGLTAPNFTLEALGLGGVPGQTGGGPYAYINGLQIVATTPEPSSICLLGLAAASLFAVHRRRRCV